MTSGARGGLRLASVNRHRAYAEEDARLNGFAREQPFCGGGAGACRDGQATRGVDQSRAGAPAVSVGVIGVSSNGGLSAGSSAPLASLRSNESVVADGVETVGRSGAFARDPEADAPKIANAIAAAMANEALSRFNRFGLIVTSVPNIASGEDQIVATRHCCCYPPYLWA